MNRLTAAQRLLIAQFFKFGLVGVVGYIADVSVLTFCTSVLGMGPYVGRLFSFLASASTTWICNRHFTFRGQGQDHAGLQWAKFVAVSIGGFCFNYGTYAALVASMPLAHNNLFLAVAAGSLAGMVFNFSASRHLVFRS